METGIELNKTLTSQ